MENIILDVRTGERLEIGVYDRNHIIHNMFPNQERWEYSFYQKNNLIKVCQFFLMIIVINSVTGDFKMTVNTLGAFYELPDGKISYTYAWSGSTKMVSYYFDDDKGGRSIHESETSKWKLRKDLCDFPNARDPRLPQIFDTFWDIKYRSQLVYALKHGHADIKEIRKMMKSHAITV